MRCLSRTPERYRPGKCNATYEQRQRKVNIQIERHADNEHRRVETQIFPERDRFDDGPRRCRRDIAEHPRQKEYESDEVRRHPLHEHPARAPTPLPDEGENEIGRQRRGDGQIEAEQSTRKAERVRQPRAPAPAAPQFERGPEHPRRQERGPGVHPRGLRPGDGKTREREQERRQRPYPPPAERPSEPVDERQPHEAKQHRGKAHHKLAIADEEPPATQDQIVQRRVIVVRGDLEDIRQRTARQRHTPPLVPPDVVVRETGDAEGEGEEEDEGYR